MILDRRQAIVTSSIFLPPFAKGVLGNLAISNCSDLICNYTPVSFREDIKLEDLFLYRGNTIPLDDVAQVVDPEPDLLMEGTYDDPLALKYFECLEKVLCAFPVRPSTGHIATSNQQEAGKWGQTVSVWPLGSSWAYVWPEDNEIFFPTKCKDQCDDSELALNQRLPDALHRNREVLFTSWFDDQQAVSLPKNFKSLRSAFLIIPSRFDAQLKVELQKRNYGLS
ncbi:unnamed protein product [Cylindrotheca closterium]|uniref:Uncharacterized protein n=1 Tax=Cylindrotheca closterium TaxID=2856 RepID=A0AAD2JHG7_9STRA|nr:unnamed protein product [Cylindrotheca closterium]